MKLFLMDKAGLEEAVGLRYEWGWIVVFNPGYPKMSDWLGEIERDCFMKGNNADYEIAFSPPESIHFFKNIAGVEKHFLGGNERIITIARQKNKGICVYLRASMETESGKTIFGMEFVTHKDVWREFDATVSAIPSPTSTVQGGP